MRPLGSLSDIGELLAQALPPGTALAGYRGSLSTVWDTRDDARRDVFAYLGHYNHDRLHSTLDYRTPHEVRIGCRQDPALVA